MIPVGKGTKKIKGINTMLCNNSFTPIAVSEFFKDLIIKFQPACNVAANNINKNIFDSKQLYREWTGGGHKVHTTDNVEESKTQLLLLLNLEYDKLLKEKKFCNSCNYLHFG